MGLIDQINSDLKQALLSGDRLKSETLKGVKNALQYVQTAAGHKDTAGDGDVLSVLKKESKKRREAAEAYKEAGDDERGGKEEREKAIIDSYLPEQLSEQQLDTLIEKAIAENNIERTQQNMGTIIKLVRTEAGAQADGAAIAKLVKEKVSS